MFIDFEKAVDRNFDNRDIIRELEKVKYLWKFVFISSKFFYEEVDDNFDSYREIWWIFYWV